MDQLADTLGVTLQTVRRDVQRLAESGLLTRFHGGVRVPSSTVENLAHTQRETLHADGKARIARAVAEQVPNDCSLILNIGTTTEAIAKALLHHRGLRVITNNLNVAAILSSNPECEVIVAGGVVRARDRGIVGEAAVDFIRQFRVDIALIGISGIEPYGSLRDFRLPRSEGGANHHRAVARGLGWRPTTANSTARPWCNWQRSIRSSGCLRMHHRLNLFPLYCKTPVLICTVAA